MESPTIIVTAFDAFRATASHPDDDGVLGLEDIRRKASSLLGPKFFGCVRYGDPQWVEQLRDIIGMVPRSP
jgi:hypothetical protein